jgi:hypothetical protein
MNVFVEESKLGREAKFSVQIGIPEVAGVSAEYTSSVELTNSQGRE